MIWHRSSCDGHVRCNWLAIGDGKESQKRPLSRRISIFVSYQQKSESETLIAKRQRLSHMKYEYENTAHSHTYLKVDKNGCSRFTSNSQYRCTILSCFIRTTYYMQETTRIQCVSDHILWFVSHKCAQISRLLQWRRRDTSPWTLRYVLFDMTCRF